MNRYYQLFSGGETEGLQGQGRHQGGLLAYRGAFGDSKDQLEESVDELGPVGGALSVEAEEGSEGQRGPYYGFGVLKEPELFD